MKKYVLVFNPKSIQQFNYNDNDTDYDSEDKPLVR